MTDGNDDKTIERVLRAAGGRAQPSAEMQESVRAAVHAQWRATVAARKGRNRRAWLAAAASFAVAAVGILTIRTVVDPSSAVVVASVSRATGDVKSRESLLSGWKEASSERSVHDGDTVMTGFDGRAALTLADGVSLRLDHETRIAFEDAEHVEVLAGAVYVDSGGATPSAKPLEIHTPAGAVRHVGTQYEVRLVDAGTRLRVREGRVELTPADGASHSVGPGEQVVVSESGVLAREPVATSGSEWEWVLHVAPPFDIEGRPVIEFLSWAARELGREIVFASPESEAEAQSAVLSGTMRGLTPAEAIAAVLPTTRLRSLERDDQLVIALDR
jgi:hypothetical protein